MSKLLLIIGVVLGLLAAVMVKFYIDDIQAQQVSSPFVKLKSNVALAAGDAIRKEHLEEERLPARFKSLSRIAMPYTKDTLTWLEGRRVTADVDKGDFLLHAHFRVGAEERFSGRIRAGYRAISVPVSRQSSVSFFVEPGSYVDILGTFENDVLTTLGAGDEALSSRRLQKNMVTKHVLQTVKVLAVGLAETQAGYQDARADGYNTITLEVLPEQAELLVLAMQRTRGELTLVLRNPADKETVATPSVDLSALQ